MQATCAFCKSKENTEQISIGISGYYAMYPALCSRCLSNIVCYLKCNFWFCPCGGSLKEDKTCSKCGKDGMTIKPLPKYSNG